MSTENEPLPGMIGQHPSMRELFALVRRVAPTDLAVPIVGETGTGKELVAQALHCLSKYASGDFIDINCAAIPEHLVEAELFGWERHAFTGAGNGRAGLMEHAHQGTLFLDEACSLPIYVQAKLLRALELGRFRRVGGRDHIVSRFRLVLALQLPLSKLVASGAFLPAFAHRVNGVVVEVPCLSRRGSDVRLLATHFLGCQRGITGLFQWSEEALREIERQPWPGNVRELKSFVARTKVLADSNILGATDVTRACSELLRGALTDELIAVALERSGGNESSAARSLGVPRTTLRSRIQRGNLFT